MCSDLKLLISSCSLFMCTCLLNCSRYLCLTTIEQYCFILSLKQFIQIPIVPAFCAGGGYLTDKIMIKLLNFDYEGHSIINETHLFFEVNAVELVLYVSQ